MALWQEGNNKKLHGVSTFEGGVNTGVSLFAVSDKETIDDSGWDTFEYPARGTRKGRTAYGTSGAGVTYLLTNYEDVHLVRAVGTKLQYNSTGTTWADITGTFTATDWDAVNFDVSGPVLIMTNGTDDVKYWDGSALTNLNAADAPKGKYITADPSRVWIAVGDVIYYCAFQDATDWTTAENSGSVEYYTYAGGDITALANFNNLKCIWKVNSFALIYGVSYYDFKLVEVSNAIGCVSFKTVREVNGRIFWLGQKDVYYFTQGSPVPIGQKIRSYLDNVNQAQIGKCISGTDGLRYYLGLVTGSETEPNVMCVFDTRYNVWNVYDDDIPDLRYSANFNGEWYCGNADGQTYKMNDGDDDDGTAISWYLTTGPRDEKVPEAEKTYLDLHLQGLFKTGTTLAVSVCTQDQGGTFIDLTYDPTTAADYGQNRNVVVPLDNVPLTYKTRFKLSGTGRVQIEQMQRYYRIQRVQR